MRQNAELLLGHIKSAEPLIAAGEDYSARNGWEWAISPQVINGVRTNKIAVICDDDAALVELTAHLQSEGYILVEHPRIGEVAGALVITPRAINK